VIIRPAEPDDAREITAVWVRAWQVAYAGVVPAEFLMAMDVESHVPYRRKRIAELAPPSAMLVACEDEGVVGFANVSGYRTDPGETVGPDVGEVCGIYVHPSRWSTGTGYALMEAAVAQLRKTGFTDVRLWVLDENPRARRFYERFGYVADGAAKMFTVDRDGPNEAEVREVRYRLAVG
jgi:GNAT superfamily N-acetyltransferase